MSLSKEDEEVKDEGMDGGGGQEGWGDPWSSARQEIRGLREGLQEIKGERSTECFWGEFRGQFQDKLAEVSI